MGYNFDAEFGALSREVATVCGAIISLTLVLMAVACAVLLGALFVGMFGKVLKQDVADADSAGPDQENK